MPTEFCGLDPFFQLSSTAIGSRRRRRRRRRRRWQ